MLALGLWLLAALPLLVLLKIIYNVFLHPLRHHPGPKLWSATRIPWCWNQYRGKLNHRLVDLHRQYGPTVRVAPDEISYTSDTAWKTIYGHRTVEMTKDPIFSLITPTGVPNIITADRVTHSRHRRLLSHAFSEKALREQEDILVQYCTKLLDQLQARCSDGPLDLAKWFPLTTFDLIGFLAFGQDFSCIDTGKPHPFVACIKDVSRELIMSQMARYYGISSLRHFFFLRGSTNSRFANAMRAKEMVEARIARGPTDDRKDFWHHVLAAEDQGKGLTPDEMVVDAFSIAIAGSDGTATALAGTIHLLLTHRDVYQQLQGCIRQEFEAEENISTLALSNDRVPLLDAVIQESMRLFPPVAITLPRVVPPGGEAIDGLFVPEGTIVGVNQLAAYHSEKNFGQASEFLPERWLNERGDCRAVFQPFSVGPRNCLGKNLAKAELRLILVRMLWRFDMELVPECEGWMDGQKIYGFWTKPPLLVKLSPRVN
ncbi:hypothetical protein CDV36_005981 [Fusarium kuroshium]|uniref:Uncharacterized protein n=1 Tax=Fusarium kuroshium TaxID=2010991 RepID=A0A3M2S9Z0_9HYPO|nr:hypothetical protein CDV36_005981 [Fusarium kuroshium]